MSTQQNSKFGGEQYAMILNFLEDPVNKAKIWGVPGKTEVGVAPPRKVDAWKELASLINNKWKGKYTLDHKSMADRWRTYFTKYKNARAKSSATEFGLTDEDRKQNIHTVQAKLDAMCPHYERMHALVGRRPNVSPAACFESGSISSDVDLNEILRYNVEDVVDFMEDDARNAIADSSSAPLPPIANASGVPVTGLDVFNNDIELLSPLSQQSHAAAAHEPEDGVLPSAEVESPVLPEGVKRDATEMPSSAAKKAKKDRRKDFPTLSASKTPTQARNLLVQKIKESATVKAVALAAIEEKRAVAAAAIEEKKLKFEQLKWDTEREEKEFKRRQEQADSERRWKLDEQRRIEDMEEERKRRAEDKAEKCRERRFALLQSMHAEGKSAEEIKEFLSLLL